MDKGLEMILIEELSDVFGSEYALTIIDLEKERVGDDPMKLLGGIRNLMLKAGGERFAELIYSRIQARMKGD